MFNKNNYTNNFNQFFIDYQRRFIHFASTYVHDEAVAEDFVIESIMYYWENKERLPSDINIPAYVLTVLKHKCIDYLRNQQVRQMASDKIFQIYSWELSNRIATLEELEPNEIFTAEIQEIVNRTLETLPEQTRRIYAMSRYENRPIEHDNKRCRISYKQSHKSSTNSFKRLFANNATSFFLKLENHYNSNHTFSLPMYPIF